MKNSQLRILHVIGGDMNGGAAKGAINLHNALIGLGITSFVVNNYENFKINNLVRRGSSKYKVWLYDRFDKWPLYFYFSLKKIISKKTRWCIFLIFRGLSWVQKYLHIESQRNRRIEKTV